MKFTWSKTKQADEPAGEEMWILDKRLGFLVTNFGGKQWFVVAADRRGDEDKTM